MKSDRTSDSRSTNERLKAAIRAERRNLNPSHTTSDRAAAPASSRLSIRLDRQIAQLLRDLEESTEYAAYDSPANKELGWHTLALKRTAKILVRVDRSPQGMKRRSVTLGTGETMPFTKWRRLLLAKLARVIVRLENADSEGGFRPAASRTFRDGVRDGAAWAGRTYENDLCRFLDWLQKHNYASDVNLTQSGFLRNFHETFICPSEDDEDDLDSDEEEEWKELCGFWEIDPSWSRHLNHLPDRYLKGFVRGARRIAVQSRGAMRARKKQLAKDNARYAKELAKEVARDANELAAASARITERKKLIRKRLRASRKKHS